MTSLRASAFLVCVAAGSVALVPSVARAAPGCAPIGGGCTPLDRAHPAVLGVTCDATCPSDFCVAGFCVDPAVCEVPCSTTGTDCPDLTIGNNLVRPESGTAGSGGECGYATGCGFVVASRAEGFSVEGMPTSPCLHADDTGVLAFLNGDCDLDGVRNVAEGVQPTPMRPSYLCDDQIYAGPSAPSPIPTCPDACRGAAGCVPFPPGPHGGSVCADGGAAAYGCTTLAACPSTFDRPAMACLTRNDFPGTVIGACLYSPTCRIDASACFDFSMSRDPGTWLETAYSRGDCDRDLLLNADDPADCGRQLVVWTGDHPRADLASRAGCDDGLMCTMSECTRLGICAVPGAIGLACDPDSPRVDEYCAEELHVDAECVYAGTSTDAAEGVCVPSDPADDSCMLRGRECFATDGTPPIDPADSYHLGDCDGDGLINGEDDDVCVPFVPDAGGPPGIDAGLAFPEVGPVDEGGLSEPDAASSQDDDAGGGPVGMDAGPPVRFAGSGCSCRVERAPAPSAIGLLALAALGLLVRARRARSRG